MDVIGCGPKMEAVALTRPRLSVNTSTKWAVNITRKYHVASSAMMSKIILPLSPEAFVLLAR